MAEAFDTLTAAEKLQNGGLSDDQSKAIAHVIGDAISGNVATKSDIENVRESIEHLRESTRSDIENLRVATKGDIEVLKIDIEALESRLKLWMFKALGTVAAVIVVVTKILDYVLDKIPT